jgi:hypothetical protein
MGYNATAVDWLTNIFFILVDNPSVMPIEPQTSAQPETQSFFPEDCVFHPTTNNYVMIVAFCVIFCLSVIGNSIVVLVILQVSLKILE